MYQYALKLFDLLAPRLDVIFYTDADDVELVDDGERSVNNKFRNDIILSMKSYLGYSACKDKVVYLRGSPEERMKTILETMNNL